MAGIYPTTKYCYLAAMQPFRSPALTEAMIEAGIVRHFEAGQPILRENSYVSAIPILRSGLIGVYRTDDDGREILLYYIRSGESCIMSFLAGLNHDTSKVSAIAEEASEMLFVPIEKAGQWVQQYPEWADYIFRLYHRRFEELLSVVNAIAFQRMDERILSHLNRKAEVTGARTLTLTHQQLADELATTREVVSRILKQMEKEGIVTLGRNKIVLV